MSPSWPLFAAFTISISLGWFHTVTGAGSDGYDGNIKKADDMCKLAMLPARSRSQKLPDSLDSLVACAVSGDTGAVEVLLTKLSKEVRLTVSYLHEVVKYVVLSMPNECEALHSHQDIISLLLEHGATLDLVAGIEGSAPSLSKFKLFLDSRSSEGQTALSRLASKGDVNGVRNLLEAGASHSVRDNLGRSPLLIAIINEHMDTVKALLDGGADVSIADSEGNHPLCVATVARGIVGMELIEAGANMDSLCTCGGAKWKEATSGVPREETVSAKAMPLFKALGADVKFLSDETSSYLIACSAGNAEAFKPLIAAGLFADTHSGDPRILQVILEREGAVRVWPDVANVGLRADAEGNTLLHYACDGSYSMPVVDFILDLERLLTLNAKNNAGHTPLIIAVWRGNRIAVERLLAVGVDTSIRDSSGMSAFDYAWERNDYRIMAMLDAPQLAYIFFMSTSMLYNMCRDLGRLVLALIRWRQLDWRLTSVMVEALKCSPWILLMAILRREEVYDYPGVVPAICYALILYSFAVVDFIAGVKLVARLGRWITSGRRQALCTTINSTHPSGTSSSVPPHTAKGASHDQPSDRSGDTTPPRPKTNPASASTSEKQANAKASSSTRELMAKKRGGGGSCVPPADDSTPIPTPTVTVPSSPAAITPSTSTRIDSAAPLAASVSAETENVPSTALDSVTVPAVPGAPDSSEAPTPLACINTTTPLPAAASMSTKAPISPSANDNSITAPALAGAIESKTSSPSHSSSSLLSSTTVASVESILAPLVSTHVDDPYVAVYESSGGPSGECGSLRANLRIATDYISLSSMSLIEKAATLGQIARVMELMHAPDIDKGGEECARAMVLAAQEGHGGLVGFMLGCGGPMDSAYYNTYTTYVYTPLLAAILNDRVEVVRLLLSAGAKCGAYALFIAIRDASQVVVEAIIDAGGVDINSTTADGTTALLAAVIKQNTSLVSMLIRRGVDIETSDALGRSALYRSCQLGCDEMARLLLSLGAHANSVDACGSTYLMICARGGHLSTVQLLLGAGAQVCMTSNMGVTALMMASKATDSSLDVVHELLEAGAKAHTVDKLGRSAVHPAVMSSGTCGAVV